MDPQNPQNSSPFSTVNFNAKAHSAEFNIDELDPPYKKPSYLSDITNEQKEQSSIARSTLPFSISNLLQSYAPYVSLIIGSFFLLFAFILFAFSTEGTLTLSWSSAYWPFYTLISLVTLSFGLFSLRDKY